MTYFEYGYNLDAQQKKDNEQYENNRKVIRVINDKNTPPPNVHKVPKGKNVKELIKNKKSKNWIIDQIATKGYLFLLAGESGSGITSLFFNADAIASWKIILILFKQKTEGGFYTGR